MALHYALTIFAAMSAWNAGAVWFFCSYLPARWDRVSLPGEMPDAPELIQYTEGTPDLRGLV